jgi:CspA family cold shock protein
MAIGTVKWFNATKGFGFIQPDAGGADVFVHISAVERAGMRDLNEGQKIAYEVVADRRTGLTTSYLPCPQFSPIPPPLVSARAAHPLYRAPHWLCLQSLMK